MSQDVKNYNFPVPSIASDTISYKSAVSNKLNSDKSDTKSWKSQKSNQVFQDPNKKSRQNSSRRKNQSKNEDISSNFVSLKHDHINLNIDYHMMEDHEAKSDPESPLKKNGLVFQDEPLPAENSRSIRLTELRDDLDEATHLRKITEQSESKL